MTYRDEITADYVRTILDYDPETGVFTWKERDANGLSGVALGGVKTFNIKHAGKISGSIDSEGYWAIRVGRSPIRAHILAFLIMIGRYPPSQVDHANRNRVDNRWSNLRLATFTQNGANTMRTGRTGFKGVSRCPRGNMFRAQIFANGKFKHLGTFKTPEEANAAYKKAAEGLWGEYACA